jgi:hypothetical protein
LTDTVGGNFGSQTVLVGPGPDGNYFWTQYFDLNAGVNGDMFTITSTGFYCGITCFSGNEVWTLSNLNFGAPLIGFDIILSISGGNPQPIPCGTSALPRTVTIQSLTPTSVAFSYPDICIPQQLYFEAQFIVGDATTPLPAALPLFASGLGALGLLGWRRKRKNAA